MNLLQMEDLVKGMPDQQLMQEAQQPSGTAPQFLLISEVDRRKKMRESYAQDQAKMPEGTIADKILNQGIMGTQPQQQPPHPSQMPPRRPDQNTGLPTGQGIVPSQQQFPPQQPPNAALYPPQPQPQMPPQGMAEGGLVGLTPQVDPNQIPQMVQSIAEQEYSRKMAGGGAIRMADGGVLSDDTFPFSQAGLTYRVNRRGYPTDQVAFEEALEGRNPWVGEPYATPGETDNETSFNPDGSLRSDAAMRGKPIPYSDYADAFPNTPAMTRQAQPDVNLPEVNASSFGPSRSEPVDIMGKQNVTDPRWDNITGKNPTANGIAAFLSSSSDATDVPSMSDAPTAEAIANYPERKERPLNPYEKGTAARKGAYDRGEIATLKNIFSNQSQGLPWNANVPPSQRHDDANANFASLFDGVTDSATWNTLGSKLKKSSTDGLIYDYGNSIKEGWDASIWGKLFKSPVDDEKQSQYAAADDVSVQAKKTPSPEQAETDGIESLLADLRGNIDSVSSTKGMPNPYGEDSALDLSDLVSKSDDDSYRTKLMLLGAGIADNNLSEGIRNAALAGAKADSRTRELELQGRVSESERKQKHDAYIAQMSEYDFNRQAKIMGLEIDYARVKAYAAANEARGASKVGELVDSLQTLEMRKMMDGADTEAIQKAIDGINQQIILLVTSQGNQGDVSYNALAGT